MVELITSNLDSLPPTATTTPQPNSQQQQQQQQQFERHPTSTSGATSGLIEGLNTSEAVLKHFKNSLLYIQGRKLGRGTLASSIGASGGGGGGGGGGSEGEREAQEGIQRLYRDVEVQGVLLKLGIGHQ